MWILYLMHEHMLFKCVYNHMMRYNYMLLLRATDVSLLSDVFDKFNYCDKILWWTGWHLECGYNYMTCIVEYLCISYLLCWGDGFIRDLHGQRWGGLWMIIVTCCYCCWVHASWWTDFGSMVRFGSEVGTGSE